MIDNNNSSKLMKKTFSFVSNFKKLSFFIIVLLKPFKKIWVLHSPTLQKELLQISFLCIFRTTIAPHQGRRKLFNIEGAKSKKGSLS